VVKGSTKRTLYHQLRTGILYVIRSS